MTKRNAAVAVAVGLMMVTAGCGFLLGNEALSFEASAATVSEDARSDTGYERTGLRSQTVNRTYEVADQTREVEVTNEIAQYERGVDLSGLGMGSQRAAVFAVFSTPQVEVAGQTFNPIEDMSTRDLLDRFESGYEGLSVGEQVDSRGVSALGEETTLEKYEGTATLAGQEIPVYVHVTEPVRHDGDFVVALAVYPQVLDGEEENVVALVEDIEH